MHEYSASSRFFTCKISKLNRPSLLKNLYFSGFKSMGRPFLSQRTVIPGPVTLHVSLAVVPLATARDLRCEITSGGLIIWRSRCHAKSRSRSVISASLSDSDSSIARCSRISCNTCTAGSVVSSSAAFHSMVRSSFIGIRSLSESYAACSAAFCIASSSAAFFAASSAAIRAFTVVV